MSNKLYDVGDILGDCAKCGDVASIKYRGGDSAYCAKCGVICEIQFDDDERIIDSHEVDSTPNYIRKSRPWRWVHELKRTGNPYTPNTKSWRVFNLIASSTQARLSLPDLVDKVCDDLKINTDSISYLITIHEVITQGRYAGLLCIEDGMVAVVKQ